MLTLEKLLKKLSYKFKINLPEAEKFLCYMTESNFLEKSRSEQNDLLKKAEADKYIFSNISSISSSNIFPSSSISKDILDNNNILDQEIINAGHSQRKVLRAKYDKSKVKVSVTMSRIEKDFKPPKEIRFVIDFWNSLGLRKCNPGTKTHQKAVKSIRKLRLGFHPMSKEKFSYQQIKETIQKFSLSALDPNYLPANGTKTQTNFKNMALGEFIWSDYLKRSTFLICHEGPLKTVHGYNLDPKEDQNPVITQTLINLYTDSILGGIKPNGGFDTYNLSKFVNAAKRTVEFFDRNKDKMNLQVFQIYDPQDFAKLVWEAVEKDVRGLPFEITPGFLSSDATFHRRLPKYLYEEGLIDDRRMVMV